MKRYLELVALVYKSYRCFYLATALPPHFSMATFFVVCLTQAFAHTKKLLSVCAFEQQQKSNVFFRCFSIYMDFPRLVDSAS